MSVAHSGSKLIAILMLVAFFTYLLSPMRIGPAREFRFMHYLKETRILQDHRSTEELLENLQSPDINVQADALMTMSRQESPDPALVKVLRQYIDGKNAFSLKNLAIYALGELRVKESLQQLESRLGDTRYDQEGLNDAIGKIKGLITKPWWK